MSSSDEISAYAKENHPIVQLVQVDMRKAQMDLIADCGTFYQKTGGRWIDVLTSEGNKALKCEIRIGRQNPKYYEVLEGLNPGEKVITSGFDNFGDNECLI